MRFLTVLVALLAMAPSPQPTGAGPEPSGSCGECHRAIYRTWKASAHARSLDNEVFLQTYRRVQEEARVGTGVCLDCHAPLVLLNGDRELTYRLTWEGVSCEVCHSLVAVDVSGKGARQVLEPGPAKRGPFGDGATPAHEIVRSELHTSALACAWCHEYANPEGMPILTTFAEWSNSSFAERGELCQNCHMAQTDTGVDEPRLERVGDARVNLHRVPGGHSIEQLNRALGLSIDSRRDENGLILELQVHNKGAGHAVPTGMPGRRVILDLEVRTSAGERFEERRVYGKFFRDADGRTITRDGDYFVPGVRLESDSRIAADERRSEVFRFPVPPTGTVFVTAKLHYEHSPLGSEDGRTWITFLSEKRTLAPEVASNADPERVGAR